MPIILRIENPFTLTPDDRARLELFAPWFEVDFRQAADDTYQLGRRAEVGGKSVTLSVADAHRRLLMEICSRAAPWVYFNFRKSARDSLLNLDDARVQRIAALYALSVANERRTAADDCASLQPVDLKAD